LVGGTADPTGTFCGKWPCGIAITHES
jgi:hypothetical protein